MIINIKDSIKLIGIVIMCACAALPCALFMNSNIDLEKIKDSLVTEQQLAVYDATLSMGNLIIAVSGGVLSITTVIMLFFYIKHYIDTRKAEIGILKALGYSNFSIAKSFWVFGFSVFIGACIGFAIAFIMMPAFYREMRGGDEWGLPDVPLHFNFELVLFLIIIPTIVFMLLAIGYSFFKLKRPVLELIKGVSKSKVRKFNQNDENISFLKGLKKGTIKSRPSLVFFIGLASFCYADMVQMSITMYDIGSKMMGIMMLLIGLVLAFTTLFIAITTVIKGNTKTIAMLRIFGYSDKECASAILNGYRFSAIIGFIIGTGYQFGLMSMMIYLFYTEDTSGFAIEYSFDVPALVITLVSFTVIYEGIMLVYTNRLKRISLKAVMGEE